MKILREAAGYGRLCSKMGFVGGSSGNLSVNDGKTIWITRTGAAFRTLCEEDFVSVDPETGASSGQLCPSKELPMHLAGYRQKPECMAIFHLHPIDCIAAGILLGPDCRLPLYVPAHFIKLGTVWQTGFFKAGSAALAEAVGERLARSDAVLLYRHGIVVSGTSLEEGFRKVEYLTEACRLYLQLKGQGASFWGIESLDALP